MGIDKKIKSSKPTLFFLGGLAVIIGITLTLAGWSAVVMIFRGVIGPVIALGGLLLLYMARE